MNQLTIFLPMIGLAWAITKPVILGDGQPDDIGNAVRFFAEPHSSYVTGQLLYVCGGRSLSSPSV